MSNVGSSIDREPKGLGGWLILLAFCQVAVIARLIQVIVDTLVFRDETFSAARPAATGVVIVHLVLLALAIAVAVVMLRRLAAFAKLWKVQVVCLMLLPFVDEALIVALLSKPLSLPIRPVIGTIVLCAPWWRYLNVSRRVANTFVG